MGRYLDELHLSRRDENHFERDAQQAIAKTSFTQEPPAGAAPAGQQFLAVRMRTVEKALKQAGSRFEAAATQLESAITQAEKSGLPTSEYKHRGAALQQLSEEHNDPAQLKAAFLRNVADARSVLYGSPDGVYEKSSKTGRDGAVRTAAATPNAEHVADMGKLMAGNGQMASEHAAQVTGLLLSEHDQAFLQEISKRLKPGHLGNSRLR